MALVTPTTKELSDNIVAQIETTLNQTVPLLPKSFIRVLAKATAGVLVLLFKYAGFSFEQQFVQTASIEETEVNGVTLSPLKLHGELFGVGNPAPATSAELDVTVFVTNQTGNLPSSTQMVGQDNRVVYLTVGAVLLDAPTVTVRVVAASDQSGGDGSGAIGNLPDGATISFVSPPTSVNKTAEVLQTATTGADGEDVEAYRQRILDRSQKRPQGGALADYEGWALEVPGIIGVFPYTGDPGEVDVYIEATVESSGNADGIPTAAQLQTALDYINFDPVTLIADRAPANALVNTFAITRVPFDVTVEGLIVDDLAGVRTSIETALTEYFLSRSPFIVGLTFPPRLDFVDDGGVGGVVSDIVSASGGRFTTSSVFNGALEVDSFELGIGEKAKLISVTFL